MDGKGEAYASKDEVVRAQSVQHNMYSYHFTDDDFEDSGFYILRHFFFGAPPASKVAKGGGGG